MTQEFDPAAFRAQLAQAQAALKDLAQPISEFWKALVEAGMDKSAATATVCTWVAGVLQQGKGQS